MLAIRHVAVIVAMAIGACRDRAADAERPIAPASVAAAPSTKPSVELSTPPPTATYRFGEGGVTVEVTWPRPDEMVAIAATRITIGAAQGSSTARPPHAIDVPAFGIDVRKVDVHAYRSCVQAGRCTAAATGPGCPTDVTNPYPESAVCVSFEQAANYCRVLAKRLPTEDEWELAARGTRGFSHPWGNGRRVEPLCKPPKSGGHCIAGMPLCDVEDCTGGTNDVSPLGVSDLGSGPAEWTSSSFCPYTEPTCAATERVVRGGRSAEPEADGSATARRGVIPAERIPGVGFRCAR
jgi:formylglycine-generating enzyme required for sulfatase activity